MHCLIDADIVAYRCAAVTADADESIAIWQAHQMVDRILLETQSETAQLYLTGVDNFRYTYNSEYKANRKDIPKPIHLWTIKQALVSERGAIVVNGREADDALGCAQTSAQLEGTETVIASIDKDLLMIPGKHYNFVKQEWKEVDQLEGLRHFYYQLIMGDTSDNIFGFDGLARQKIPKKLQWAIDKLYETNDELEMYCHVKDMYKTLNGMTGTERMHMNAHCLWIERVENERWKPPIDNQEEEGATTEKLW